MGKKVKIACIGDSVVFGLGIHEDREAYVWTTILEELLNGEEEPEVDDFAGSEFSEANHHHETHESHVTDHDGGEADLPEPGRYEYEVRNFGLSGQAVMPGAFVPLGQMDTPLYKEMIEWEPDAVFMHVGGNDSHAYGWDEEAFRREYRKLAQDLVDRCGRGHVCLMESTYALTDEGAEEIAEYGINNEVVMHKVNPIIAETAEELGTALIDINTVFLSIPEMKGRATELYADGIHPNEAGNEVIADVAYAIASGWEF